MNQHVTNLTRELGWPYSAHDEPTGQHWWVDRSGREAQNCETLVSIGKLLQNLGQIHAMVRLKIRHMRHPHTRRQQHLEPPARPTRNKSDPIGACKSGLPCVANQALPACVLQTCFIGKNFCSPSSSIRVWEWATHHGPLDFEQMSPGILLPQCQGFVVLYVHNNLDCR